MKRSPFTLIELLVVISIIAILASMLLPSLGKAREKSRGVTCANGMKQMGLAWLMYADESDEIVPMGCRTAPSGRCWDACDKDYLNGTANTTIHIMPYINAWEPYQCPSVQGVGNSTRNYNYYISNAHSGTGSGSSLGQFQKPSQTAVYGEGNGYRWLRGTDVDGGSTFWRMHGNHNRRVNMTFSDGHVSNFAISQIPNTVSQNHDIWLRLY